MRYAAALSILLMLIGCGNEEETLKIKRDIANLQEQIYEIERSQENARQELDRSLDEVNRKLSDSTDMADLKEQIATIREAFSQYDARMEDLETKLANIDRSRTSVAPASAENESLTSDPVPNVNDRVSGEVVEQQFNQALLDFNRGKFNVAALGFEGVLESFPNSPYSEAAHYYLARSYREAKDFRKAVDHFRVIAEKYPRGDFLKQAMYYEGECYYYLNQHSRAIITLRDLVERFPGTQEAVLAEKFLKKAGYEK